MYSIGLHPKRSPSTNKTRPFGGFYTAAGATGPGANEPVGFTQINDYNMSALPTVGTPNAAGLTYTGYISDMALASDPSAIASPPTVYDLIWPPSAALGGSAPNMKWQFGDPITAAFPVNANWLYSREHLMISSNFTHNNNIGTKRFFLQNNNIAGGIGHFTAFYDEEQTGPPNNNCYLFLGTQFGADPASNAAFYSGYKLTKGVWLDIELVINPGTAGNHDGEIWWFVNGVQVAHHTGVMWRLAGQTLATGWAWWEPTYGFGPSATPAFTMHWYIDHWYMSYKP